MMGTYSKKPDLRQAGFTLIELMIVVAIIGILASVAMGAYQTYTVRAQVTEGLSLITSAKVPIVEKYLSTGEAPANRFEAGLTADATDTFGNYVESVEAEDGRLGVTFGNRANAMIASSVLYLTPYETPEGSVIWRCGDHAQPSGPGGPLATLGTNGGGNAASYISSMVDTRFLPSTSPLKVKTRLRRVFTFRGEDSRRQKNWPRVMQKL